MNGGAAGREELTGQEMGVTFNTKLPHCQPFSSHNMNGVTLEDKSRGTVTVSGGRRARRQARQGRVLEKVPK